MSPVDGLYDPKAKALIFDCDGTVIDTMPHHWQAWSATVEKFGVEFSLAEFLAYAGTPAKDILADLCRKQGKEGVDIAEAVKYKTQLYLGLIPKVTPIPQVVSILKAARAKGVPCAIASGGARCHVEGGLRATGLLGEFDAVVCCEDYERGKPAPDVFLMAAEKLGVSPSLCVGYEDADLGMQSIRAAGFLEAVDVRLMDGYPHLG